MKKFSGKDEKINGEWYPVTVQAENLKEAIKKLYVGIRKILRNNNIDRVEFAVYCFLAVMLTAWVVNWMINLIFK